MPHFFAGKRVLVTGASGFYGSSLVPKLIERGALVACVSRKQQGPAATSGSRKGGAVHWLRHDLAEPAAAAEVVATLQPHIIFHLTSDSRGGQELANVLPSLRNDVQATIHMLHAAASTASNLLRFVMTTSLEEPRVQPVMREQADYEPVPGSPYGAAKLVGAAYGRMFRALYGLPVVLLRPFMTYGPGQRREKLIPYVVASLHAGKAPELGSGTRMVDWVYVDDVIDAFLLAAERDISGRTIDLGWGRMIAIRAVVELIHEKMGGPAPRFGAITDRKIEMERAANTTYARAHLGWTARTPLSAGLDRTIAAYTQGEADAIGKEGHAHAGL